jgi:hypothetical protein
VTPVALAALNNAEWCDLFCRTSGIEGSFDGRLWASARRTPRFYPDAVTLGPGVPAAEILGRVDAGEGCSVKDSFADVELPGFDVLFEAQWLWLERADAAPRWRRSDTTWEPFPASLAASRSVAFLTDGESGAIANRSAHVIGISNVFGDDLDAAYRGAAGAAQRIFGPLPLVGYDAEPHAGFAPIGPLRVWTRPRTA